MESRTPDARVTDLAATLFTGRLDMGTALGALTTATRDVLCADRATCVLVSPERRVAAVHTTEDDPILRARLEDLCGRDPDDLPIGRVMRDGDLHILAVEDAPATLADGRLARALEIGAALVVRLQPLGDDAGEEELGYLIGTWRRSRAIGRGERRLALALGGLAGPALLTSRLRDRTDELQRWGRGRTTAMTTAQRLARLGNWTWYPQDGRVEWSPEVYRALGVDPSTSVNADVFLSRVHPDDRAPVAERLAALGQAGTSFHLRHRIVRPDGEERVIAAMGEADLTDADGRPLRAVGAMQDVTDRVRAEEELDVRARLLDAVDAAVIATDLEGRVTHWNRAAERLYGWTSDETVGRPITELTVGPDDVELAGAAMRDLAERGHWEGEFRVRRKDGSSFPAYVRNAMIGSPSAATGIVGVSVDISARVEMEERLRAARDFLATVTDSMGDGLITLDADRCFAYVNPAAQDLLGWTAAELAGRPMHQTLHHRRPDGSPYPAEDCALLRERRDGEVVRAEDEMFVRRDGRELFVACTSVPFSTAEEGRGWVVVFTDVTERRSREEALRADLKALTWAERIREALARDRFVLHAQPIVDIATGRVTQHELLIRMRAEDASLVPPGQFLPTAEKHGLIGQIDRWVVRRSAELAAAGHAIEFNLSATSIGDPGFADVVVDALRDAGADPGAVTIELTETALLQDEATAEVFMGRLRGIGCRVALDDFGTGYGGFRYLKQLPVDDLKIDIEFVRDLVSSPASRHVVEAVVRLARAFGRQTVAEGVEDMATLRLLGELGVDKAQGYAIGRPKPVAKAFDPARLAGVERRAARAWRAEAPTPAD